MTKIIINIDTLHIDTIHTGDVSHGNQSGGANPLLAAILSGVLGSAFKAHVEHDDDDDTPRPDAPAQETPQDTARLDAALQNTQPVQYQWPVEDDELEAFDSAKNSYNDDGDNYMPTVIEVTDDWFRVLGYFTSKTGKGTRKVTLKVYRHEVESGAVKYTLA